MLSISQILFARVPSKWLPKSYENRRLKAGSWLAGCITVPLLASSAMDIDALQSTIVGDHMMH